MTETCEKITRTYAVLLLVLVATLWSLAGFLIKLVTLNPIAITGIRSSIAALIILVFRKKNKLVWSFDLVAGSIAYAGTVILFVVATKLTTAANAILLQYTSPVFVALFSAWLLKETIRPIDWITIIIVLTGLLLFFLDSIDLAGYHGNLAAIGSGICFALLILFLRKQKQASPLDSVILGNIITGIICFPFIINALPHIDRQSCISLLVLGTIQLALPYIIYTRVIRQVRAIEAATIPMLEPILNPLMVFFILGERPGHWAMIGGVIVLIAITSRAIILVKSSD